MISAKSTIFKYVNKGYRDSIVFIPGWASDYRIFSNLDLDFNYLLPVEFYPFSFEKDLKEALEKNSIKKNSRIGFKPSDMNNEIGDVASIIPATKAPIS